MSTAQLEAVLDEAARDGKAWGYVRVSTNRQVLSPENQIRKIQDAAATHKLNLGGIFQDAPTQNKDGSWNDAASGRVRLNKRKAGAELCGRLRRGDTIIIATIDRAFRKLSDLVVQLDVWERQGINLVFCDFPMLTDLASPYQKAFVQLIGVFGELERKLASVRTKEAMACKTRKGQATNRFPGYGFMWERQFDREAGKRVRVRVANPDERHIMGQIVKWRVDGYGWDAITSNLNAHDVKTKHDTRWSRSRVIRAFHAELRLQAQAGGSRE
jgi:DNA invertase Pin-like site-specific DNA recombinase